jgi:hypothetical protein
LTVKYLSRAVVVHSLAHARAAAAIGRPVTLLSAVGAASFAGSAWWRALVERALTAYPATPIEDVLDCADAPGLALAALAGGQRLIRLESGPAWALVAARAAACGAYVLAERPAALDMARLGDAGDIARPGGAGNIARPGGAPGGAGDMARPGGVGRARAGPPGPAEPWETARLRAWLAVGEEP